MLKEYIDLATLPYLTKGKPEMKPLVIAKYLDINPEEYYEESIAKIVFNAWHTIAVECLPTLTEIPQTEVNPKSTPARWSTTTTPEPNIQIKNEVIEPSYSYRTEIQDDNKGNIIKTIFLKDRKEIIENNQSQIKITIDLDENEEQENAQTKEGEIRSSNQQMESPELEITYIQQKPMNEEEEELVIQQDMEAEYSSLQGSDVDMDKTVIKNAKISTCPTLIEEIMSRIIRLLSMKRYFVLLHY